MPIPKDILSVPRPTNTVVYAYGKNKDRYGVKERIGCVYRNGKNYPVNGATVGHIIDGKYVPIEQDEKTSSAASLRIVKRADAAVCMKLGQDILEELQTLFLPEEAALLFSIALLSVCHPGIFAHDLAEAFEQSGLSSQLAIPVPNLETLQQRLQELGQDRKRMDLFMQLNAAKHKGGLCSLIRLSFPALQDNTACSNPAWQSARAESSEQGVLSWMCTFDLEHGEPVCLVPADWEETRQKQENREFANFFCLLQPANQQESSATLIFQNSNPIDCFKQFWKTNSRFLFSGFRSLFSNCEKEPAESSLVFICFLSSILFCRLLDLFAKTGLEDRMPFVRFQQLLHECALFETQNKELQPLSALSKAQRQILQKTGLLGQFAHGRSIRKRGRPRKHPL